MGSQSAHLEEMPEYQNLHDRPQNPPSTDSSMKLVIILACAAYFFAAAAWFFPQIPSGTLWMLSAFGAALSLFAWKRSGLSVLDKFEPFLFWTRGMPFHFFWISMLAAWIYLRLNQWSSFSYSVWTLSLYSNVVSNTLHGNFLHSSVLGASHLSTHFSPIMAAFAPLYALFGEDPRLLMFVQAAAVAITAPLILFAARDILQDTSCPLALAALLGGAYLIYEPNVRAVMDDFHPSTLAPPFIVLALIALRKKRSLLLYANVSILLCIKESSALIVISLALYAWLELRRWKTALILTLCAILATSLYFALILPANAPDGWHQAGRVNAASWLSSETNILRLQYLFRLFWPLGFAPLLRWQSILWVAPQILLNVITDYPNQLSARRHYDDGTAPFLFIAVAHIGLVAFAKEESPAWHMKGKRLRQLASITILLALWLPWVSSGGSPLDWREQFKPDKSDGRVMEKIKPYSLLSYHQPVRAPGLLAAPTSNRAGMSHQQTQLDQRDFQPGNIILLSPKLDTRTHPVFQRSKGLILSNQVNLRQISKDDYLWAFYVLDSQPAS